MEESLIRVEQLRIIKNQTLSVRLTMSKGNQKYFQSNNFFVKFPEEVHDVSPSILYIPIISGIICVAWTIGADIYVEELDKTYLESLNKIRLIMKPWYPKLPFTTKIHVANIVENKFHKEGYSLLFSGGVDSLTSFFRHKNKNPQLIMIWGAENPPYTQKIKAKMEEQFQDFLDTENFKLNFINTNSRAVRNEKYLGAKFGRHLTDFSWWGSMDHYIVLTGLCAPMTVNHSGTVLFPSTFTKEFNYPWGSYPFIDNQISWGDVNVLHDGYEFSRQEKVRYLSNYMRESGRFLPLRVCWTPRARAPKNELNCSRCEKCVNAMTGLMLENINPNCCGFSQNDEFFEYLKKKVSKHDRGKHDIFMWEDIQRNIPDRMASDLCKHEGFCEWLKTFDVAGTERARNINILMRCFLLMYYRLPRNTQNEVSKHRDSLRPLRKLVFLSS